MENPINPNEDRNEIKIKMYKRYTKEIIEFYSTYLFDIQNYQMNNKKLFIVKKLNQSNKIKEIIGTFIINFEFNVLESLFIKPNERSKGYSKEIFSWLRKQQKINNWNIIYFDCYHSNTIAVKCYDKYLNRIGTITHGIFRKIYGYLPGKNIKILRYTL
jgi:hypothetical protein